MPEFAPTAATRAKGDEVAKLRKQVGDLFKEHQQADGTYDNEGDWVGQAQSLNDAIEEKAKKYETAVTLEKQAFDNEQKLQAHNQVRLPMAPDGVGGAPGTAAKTRSLGEIFETKSAELKEIGRGASGTIRWELNAQETNHLLAGASQKTLLTSADIAPQADRQAVVPSAQFLSDVTDIFTPGTTDSDTIEFYEETTFTNAAAETSEGSAAPESALDFTLRTFAVQEFSTFIPVTRRSLSDVAGLQSYVEGRLGHMLNLRRSAQLLTGNGTPPNIRGILQTSGIQTQAKGSDPTPDAIYKAMVLARTTGDAEPTGVIFHAQDWQDVRLLRTIDGVYIWGAPSEAGPERIWGNTVRVSNSITQNTALVGGFRPYAQIFRREGASIEVSTEHSTFFTERKAAVMIYERLALAVYRPAAFVQVTGV
jgi:HK97 family phage major capsid protein